MDNPTQSHEYRFHILRQFIQQLQSGTSMEQIKDQIRAIYAEGGEAGNISGDQLPVWDGPPLDIINQLCDLHAAVFRNAGMQGPPDHPSIVPGHPAHTLRSENRAIEALIEERILPEMHDMTAGKRKAAAALQKDLAQLAEIEIHYRKKEDLYLTSLKRYGITQPEKVMTGVDQEILSLVNGAQSALAGEKNALARSLIEESVNRVREMIFKEENILIPMMLDYLAPQEWNDIAVKSPPYGNCLIVAVPEWTPESDSTPVSGSSRDNPLVLSSGSLTLRQITGILDALPLGVTFVDADGIVRYVSQGQPSLTCHDKIIVGRRFANCHPPAGVPAVEKILESFKSGAQNEQVFRITIGQRRMLVRYIAVRDPSGNYLGALEVSQNIESLLSLMDD